MELPRKNLMLSVQNESAPLKRVIIGLGAPYQRDKKRAAAEMGQFPLLPDTPRRAAVIALEYPPEDLLIEEYKGYVAALNRYGVEVLRPDPEAAYSFDYTCPRDIGFVIGDRFFISSMAVPSRTEEIGSIMSHLASVEVEKIIRVPQTARLEGGDVIQFDAKTVLVGINTRSNLAGAQFLSETLAPKGISVHPIPHTRLHLDCCLNPLGMGHLLIHPESLQIKSEETWDIIKAKDWIIINGEECEQLATNILSVNERTVIARQGGACARVNQALREHGYLVDEVTFDGVPATGGSFRCASLVLARKS